jgi:hypothetical protein
LALSFSPTLGLGDTIGIDAGSTADHHLTIQSERQLITWIECNFADVDAVRDVVANIQLFGRETADFLEFRLNAQTANLPPLLVKSWALIVRHMRTGKVGFAQNECELLPV